LLLNQVIYIALKRELTISNDSMHLLSLFNSWCYCY